MSLSQSRLFKPLKLGTIELQHRVSMSPLTRHRNSDDHVPLSYVKEYYGQRASVPGTFIVTEATIIAEKYGGYANVPGIYKQAQIDAWKEVTDVVHAKGSFIFQQLWSLGRVATPQFAASRGIEVISSSATKVDDDHVEAREMTVEEIQDVVAAYAQAAKNAIAAGFDGVEIHGANGYLIDQFLQDVTNKRTDRYGGSIENRSRIALEVVQAVVQAVGAERTAIRFSPFNNFQGMGMSNPVPQFSDIVSKLNSLGLAYIHFVSGRVLGMNLAEKPQSLTPILNHYTSGPVIIAGGQTPESAAKLVDEEYKDRDVVVSFGRRFLSTPDLVFRLREGLAFNDYDRTTFYAPKTPKGYIDYPFSQEFLAINAQQP